MRRSSHHHAFLLLLTALFTITGLRAQGAGGSAQSGPPPGRMRQPPTPAMELQRIQQVLQAASMPLSDTQRSTLLGILQDRDTAMRALRSSGVSAQAAATQRAQLMAASEASVHAVLTTAQAQVYDAMRLQPPPGGMAPGQAAPPESGSAPGSQSLIDANTGGNPHSGGA